MRKPKDIKKTQREEHRDTNAANTVKQATIYAYTSWVTVPGQFSSLTPR